MFCRETLTTATVGRPGRSVALRRAATATPIAAANNECKATKRIVLEHRIIRRLIKMTSIIFVGAQPCVIGIHVLDRPTKLFRCEIRSAAQSDEPLPLQ